MPINPKVVGRSTEPLTFEYGWRDTVLYALGIGARADELDYLYEGRGPKVFPTFAVIPAFQANILAMADIGGNLVTLVHGGQTIRLARPIPPAGKLRTVATVAGIYDLVKMAQAIVTTRTTDDRGELLFETDFSIIYRGEGGFGGERPPETTKASPPQREPDFRHEETTAETQALLYRLSGDINPLHADPAIGRMAGFGRPILHGLCTYGHVGRAVVKSLCGGDGNKLRSLSAQFRKPVFPGETLVTEGWTIEPGKVVLRCTVKERNEQVITGSLAELVV
ncbi:MAG: MaoC family dehydratase N-terminal domain-containing protein [Deltaproteobacteria bacterium]|nr:MaoC family dehydratase N-terminal domain-containing protein [Deltaproteobacteria bacterium]